MQKTSPGSSPSQLACARRPSGDRSLPAIGLPHGVPPLELSTRQGCELAGGRVCRRWRPFGERGQWGVQRRRWVAEQPATTLLRRLVPGPRRGRDWDAIPSFGEPARRLPDKIRTGVQRVGAAGVPSVARASASSAAGVQLNEGDSSTDSLVPCHCPGSGFAGRPPRLRPQSRNPPQGPLKIG
jgi:hypothetical protein